MRRVLLAELAIFIQFQPIRMVFLVLIGLVIAVLANRTGQRHGITHFMHSSLTDFTTCQKVTHVLYHTYYGVSTQPPPSGRDVTVAVKGARPHKKTPQWGFHCHIGGGREI